jgi:hypothetical protein
MIFEGQLAVSLLDGWHFRASVEAHDLIRIEGLVLLGKRLDVENYNTHKKPTKYQQKVSCRTEVDNSVDQRWFQLLGLCSIRRANPQPDRSYLTGGPARSEI